MRTIRRNVLFLLTLSLVVASVYLYTSSVVIVNAQSLGSGANSSLTLRPQNPQPHSLVTVAIDAYSVNTTGASITWYLDGAELTEYANDRSIQVTIGGINESLLIRAVVRTTSGKAIPLSRTITPTVVDLIIEADTYTPLFYTGRALPSAESSIRAIAIPHIGGSLSSYTYLWKLDGKVLLGGPIRGKYALDLTMPQYRGSNISVSVLSGGNVVGGASLPLIITDPELVFYENNPLRGMGRKAIPENFTLLGEEIAVEAAPYFIDKTSATTDGEFIWKLGGKKVVNDSENPFAITLRQTGGGGTANISFEYRNTDNLFQRVTDSFKIYFE